MARIGYIQVSRQCNQHCIFCSNPPNTMQYSLRQIRDMIDELANNGNTGVIFTGGEPTCFEYLPDAIAHAVLKNIEPRIITNGRNLADPACLQRLIDAGLRIINFSLHSYRADVQNFLTDTPDSFSLLTTALENCAGKPLHVNINTVINSYNANHLDETVAWLLNTFPFIRHYVWNNLDPFFNRVTDNPHVRCRPWQFEISLNKAAALLDKSGRTFRIERVPLCFMAEYAHCSTETRKIVKEEERIIFFLDERQKTRQNDFRYEKAPTCSACRLNAICAGVYGGEKNIPMSDVFPLFIDPLPTRERILGK